MITYKPRSPGDGDFGPRDKNDSGFGARAAKWLREELANIRKAATAANDYFYFKKQTAAPAKNIDGELRYADGTNWDVRFGQRTLAWYDDTDAMWKALWHTGAGSTKTQAAGSGKATAVTLDFDTGQITMNNAALAAGANVTFTFNNATIQAGDQLVVTHNSGGTAFAYFVRARVTAAGTASINVKNDTAGSLSEAIVLRYTRIPGATA
jgi:hypothetical protein